MAQKLKFGNGTWATKKGSTLAYNDENDNYKPLPFTTTRASGATRVNKEGLIEVVENDRPRIDYTDSAKGALLLEPQRTNLITYSEDFSNAFWTKTNTTLISNNEISPDGSLNADLAYPNASSSTKYGVKIERVTSGLSSSEYTNSVFVKSNNWQWIYLIDPSGFKAVWFDVQNGIVGTKEPNASGSIEDYGNGWYKCTVNTHTSPVAYNYLGVYFSDSDNSVICTNNGTSGVYIYGAQLEQGSFPTSYIPTQGATATRVADTASGSGNSEVFSDSSGVLFANISALANENVLRKIQVNDNTLNNNITIDYYSSSNSIRANLWNGSSQYSYIHTLTDVTLSAKVAFLYKSSEFKFYVNGIKVNESSSGSTFSSGTLKTLDLSTSNGSSPFHGKTKQIAYYDEILTDLELETLTSYRSLSELVTELNLNTL